MKEDRFYSEILTNLTDRPGILNRKRYFNSVVLVPFLWLGEQPMVLFQKRSQNIRQGGEICFPGGGSDPSVDKNQKDTAIRETMEELGINENQIIIDGQMDSLVGAMGIVVDIFIGRLDINSMDELNINRDEVEKVFLIPLEYFKKNPPLEYEINLQFQPVIENSSGEKEILFPTRELGLPERYHQNWGNIKHPIYAYKTDNGVIWGITAEIIKNICHMID